MEFSVLKKMNKTMTAVVVATVTSGFSLMAAADYSGEIFAEGSAKTTKLFHLENRSMTLPDGDMELKSTFTDLKNEVVLIENAKIKGSDFQILEIEQKQLGEKASIEHRGEDLKFTLTRANGKTETASEKVKGKVLVPLTFMRFVAENWADFEANKTIPFRFAVWSRKDTVGFEMYKIGDEGLGDAKVMILKMKPSSFVIAALVKPLVFKFSYKDKLLLNSVGRVGPMQAQNNEFRDLDAEVVYHY
jgi:hypothetical protein